MNKSTFEPTIQDLLNFYGDEIGIAMDNLQKGKFTIQDVKDDIWGFEYGDAKHIQMEYTITHIDTGIKISTRKTIKGAYNLCNKLKYKGLSNYNIQEYDEENDEYTSVNVDEFVFEYEENKISDFSKFQTW